MNKTNTSRKLTKAYTKWFQILKRNMSIKSINEADESILHFLIIMLLMKYFSYQKINNSYNTLIKELTNKKANSNSFDIIKQIFCGFYEKLLNIIDLKVIKNTTIFDFIDKEQLNNEKFLFQIIDLLEDIDRNINPKTLRIGDLLANDSTDLIVIINSLYEWFQSTKITNKDTENNSKRKKYGIYYTPTYLVKSMVETTIESQLNLYYRKLSNLLSEKDSSNEIYEFYDELRQFHILDPSCGSGIFLVYSFRNLYDFYGKCANYLIKNNYSNHITSFFQINSLQIMQRHVFGIDKDRTAIDLTKVILLIEIIDKDIKHFMSIYNESINLKLSKPHFVDNLKHGDTLFEPFDHFLAMKDNRFNVIIGNPPWQKISKADYRKEQLTRYYLQKGQPDYYRFFIERCLQLCEPNKSKINLITPNSWLTIPAANKLREYVLINHNLTQIINIPKNVFKEVSTNICTFLIDNYAKKSEKIDIYDFNYQDNVIKNKESNDKKKINLILVNRVLKSNITSPDFIIKIYIPQKVLDVYNYIINNKQTVKLGEIVDMTIGYQLYHNSIHSSEDIKNKIYHKSFKKKDSYVQELRSKDIDQYYIDINNSKSYVDTNAKFFRKIPNAFENGHRLIIREIISNRGIISARLEKKYLFPKSVIVLKIKNQNQYDSSQLLNLLGILNSKLLWFEYLIVSEKGNQEIFPRISKKTLIEVKIPSNLKSLKIEEMVMQIELFMKENAKLNKENPSSVTQMDKIIGMVKDSIDSKLFEFFKLKEKQIEIILDFLK